jgi:hypothetical protein
MQADLSRSCEDFIISEPLWRLPYPLCPPFAIALAGRSFPLLGLWKLWKLFLNLSSISRFADFTSVENLWKIIRIGADSGARNPPSMVELSINCTVIHNLFHRLPGHARLLKLMRSLNRRKI